MVWRHLVRWLRQLILRLSANKPVDWPTEVNSLVAIANEALDYQGKPMPDQNPNKTPTPAPSPAPTPTPEVPPKTRLFHGRLIEWLRRKNAKAAAEAKTEK
jgi:hypothetical protein